MGLSGVCTAGRATMPMCGNDAVRPAFGSRCLSIKLRCQASSLQTSLVRYGTGAKVPPAGGRRKPGTWSSVKPVLPVAIDYYRHLERGQAMTRSRLLTNLEELPAPPSSKRQAWLVRLHALARQPARTIASRARRRVELPRHYGSARLTAIGHPH